MIRHLGIQKAGWLPSVLSVLVLVACGRRDVSLPEAFPNRGDLAGWLPVGSTEVFNSGTLYDLVDGQAEAYFAYGFEQVAVQGYENDTGQRVDVEIWQVATPSDAYGVFTANRAGEPVGFGNGGDADPGRRIAFWQDRYYVRVRTRQEVPEAVLQQFALALEAGLPTGGEPPALVDRLPTAGLVSDSPVFFHEEISIQSELWLGGENVLALSAETDGVLATYGLDRAGAQFLLVEYPDANSAVLAREALLGSDVEGLVRAEVRGALLGAVFGNVDEPMASGWLSEALGE